MLSIESEEWHSKVFDKGFFLQLSIEQIEFLQTQWPIHYELKFLRRVANFVYYAQLDGREVVLRLTEVEHRKMKELESELNWMNYLTMNGLKIASPISTVSGSYVVELPGEKAYFATVFEKAPGAFLSEEAPPSEEFITVWGKYIGNMHRLTKNYQPSKKIQRRQQWEQDETLAMALRSCESSDELPYMRLNELMEWMRNLPQDDNCYGLVHTDLHRGNFFVEDNQITAFDFDDSCYHWFSYDVVAPLNSIDKGILTGTNALAKEKALETFLKGYRSENTLEQIWLERIQAFDNYRNVLIYHWIKTCIKENVFSGATLVNVKENSIKLLEKMREPLKLF